MAYGTSHNLYRGEHDVLTEIIIYEIKMKIFKKSNYLPCFLTFV